MRAVVLRNPVPSEPEVGEAPDPEPGPDELLVRVATAALNGIDLGVMAGRFGDPAQYPYPLVLGKDFAGTVHAIGEQVTGYGVGEAVFGMAVRPPVGAGSLAEYVTVPEGFGVARVPAGVALADAGALALAGTTALTCVDAVAPQPGEPVLVAGATGGVGAMAAQYVAARGARLIATARPGVQSGFLRDLLGERVHVVDHTADLAGQVRALAPRGLAAAIHLAGDGDAVARLVADGGRLASPRHWAPHDGLGDSLTVTDVVADPDTATLDRLAADVAAGRLRVPITATYGLGDAPAALAAFRQSSFGKLSISVL
ncbi:NADP-dependent oxidoreductase [Streptomyces avicenniae]|uniref:NADP-dependent oxidoreductase n=1 Tax=Streptomyces avicenniae TaxID=500153 RepID=UPI00069AD5A7|nr:NADP-dependent oxidoreductase [Streptomyces avicenniae]